MLTFVPYVLNEIIESVYSARGPFEAILIQRQSAGHDETIISRTISGALWIAIVTCPYPAM